MQLIELTINDTSPLVIYSPFRVASPTFNLTSGWNPVFNKSLATYTGQLGVGESSHVTSMDVTCELSPTPNCPEYVARDLLNTGFHPLVRLNVGDATRKGE